MNKLFTLSHRVGCANKTGFLGVLLVLLPLLGWGQVATYSISSLIGTNATVGATGVDANANATPLSKTAVTDVSGAGKFRAAGWNTATLNTGKYFSFTVAPKSGYKATITSLTYLAGNSPSGPPNSAWRSSLDGFSADITPAALGSTFANQTTAIEFRFYAWGASISSGTGGLDADLVVNGSVVPAAAAVVSAGCLTMPFSCP